VNRLVVAVPSGAADAVANHLTEAGAAGIEFRDQETLVRAPGGQAELIAYLPAGEVHERVEALKRYVRSLRASGCVVDPWSWRGEEVDENEWRERWREFFRPSRIGRRIVVSPPWHAAHATPGDLVVIVDPGEAFGTGAHPSTRLCLRAIERLARIGRPPRVVLDVGSGSGILSAAAALVWEGCAVVAIDVDPVAVQATERTAQENGVSARIRARAESIASADGVYDLVLANLQADVLGAHRSALEGRVGPGGRLVVAGLLRDEAAAVVEDYAASGDLEAEYSEDDGEWRAICLRRA
jgi:ribosomal protein L11 methyltransferase